jgi:hypothetical protein
VLYLFIIIIFFSHELFSPSFIYLFIFSSDCNTTSTTISPSIHLQSHQTHKTHIPSTVPHDNTQNPHPIHPSAKPSNPLDRCRSYKSTKISTSNPQNICKSTTISPSNPQKIPTKPICKATRSMSLVGVEASVALEQGMVRFVGSMRWCEIEREKGQTTWREK